MDDQFKLQVIETIAKVVAAIGSLIIAALAVWGDRWRARWFGPRVVLSYYDHGGEPTTRNDGTNALYYHVRLTNEQERSPAQDVRVLLAEVHKKGADGSYFRERLVIPLQLTWAYPYDPTTQVLPTLSHGSPLICGLGSVAESEKRFWLSTYVRPNNFRGFISADESMRVHLRATGSNFESRSPLVLDFSWDGVWEADAAAMQRHLVIREVESS